MYQCKRHPNPLLRHWSCISFTLGHWNTKCLSHHRVNTQKCSQFDSIVFEYAPIIYVMPFSSNTSKYYKDATLPISGYVVVMMDIISVTFGWHDGVIGLSLEAVFFKRPLPLQRRTPIDFLVKLKRKRFCVSFIHDWLQSRIYWTVANGLLSAHLYYLNLPGDNDKYTPRRRDLHASQYSFLFSSFCGKCQDDK